MIVNLDSNNLNHGFQNKLFITKDRNTKKMFLWIYQNKIRFKEGKISISINRGNFSLKCFQKWSLLR